MLCKHLECESCSKLSVNPGTSNQYICCQCYDLHPRSDTPLPYRTTKEKQITRSKYYQDFGLICDWRGVTKIKLT
jgi:hypothetical protein